MMFYLNVAMGAAGVFLYFMLITWRPWHNFMHRHKNGVFLNGRLWCAHCAHEEQSITRREWRNEVIDRMGKFLDN
jgi:hypothetical protein